MGAPETTNWSKSPLQWYMLSSNYQGPEYGKVVTPQVFTTYPMFQTSDQRPPQPTVISPCKAICLYHVQMFASI